jgi:hypothetical protein
MIDKSADNLFLEVENAIDFRNRHMVAMKDMIKRYAGTDYDHSYQHEVRPDVDNHAYEYISLVLPKIVYDNPAVKIDSRRPALQGETVAKIQLAMNRWISDTQFRETLHRSAMDMMFGWGVLMTVSEPVPGQRPADEAVKSLPRVYRIAPEHFFMDPKAGHWTEARFMGHSYSMMRDELIDAAEGDDTYDMEAIQDLAENAGMSDYENKDTYRESSKYRDEVAIYEIWCPNTGSDAESDGKHHGMLYTLAVAGPTSDEDDPYVGYIRKPQPYYGPRSGPYTLLGVYTVPGDPYPLSPLTATNQLTQEINGSLRQLVSNGQSYKRIYLVDAKNKKLATDIKEMPDRFVIPVEGLDTQRVMPMELGGITAQHVQYQNLLTDKLDRQSGINDAQRGNLSGDATATAVAVAESGATVRLAHIQRQFSEGVKDSLHTVLWYLFHDNTIVLPLGREAMMELGEIDPIFTGGDVDGDYDDLLMTIDPYSMERTSEVVLQRRAIEVVQLIGNIAPLFAQAPWVDWPTVMGMLGQTMNIPSLGSIIDLEKAAAAMQQGMIGPAGSGGGGVSQLSPSENPVGGQAGNDQQIAAALKSVVARTGA